MLLDVQTAQLHSNSLAVNSYFIKEIICYLFREVTFLCLEVIDQILFIFFFQHFKADLLE